MSFIRTRATFGGYDIREGPPRVGVAENAMVIGWALYDERRLLVTDSAFAREGIESGRRGLTTIGAHTTTDRNIRAGRRLAEEDSVWIGHLHEHFGHFLISTLSRLWSLQDLPARTRIVSVGPGDLRRKLRLPFVASVLAALELDEERFVEVSDGDIIPRISVPEPLFVENSAAHPEMARFCLRLADAIAGPDDRGPARARRAVQPLFLTKRALTAGVRTIENESALTDILEGEGVAVASPETLSPAEQIRLWRRHRVIASFEGSGLHGALFVRDRKILTVSANAFAPSNQVLIDAIAGHQALYLNARGALAEAPAVGGFSSATRLVDPDGAARSLLAALSYLQAGSECMRMRAMRDTVSPVLFLDEPFGTNLSRGKPAEMSSVDPTWAAAAITRQEAAGAVSGRLTGRYQIHSAPEQMPWWQVDLGGPCLVNEIRIFNRNDVARERARHLVLSCSLDGAQWAILTRRTEDDDFGGGAVQLPWRWWSDAPFQARFVRITLHGPTYLHLDQVEVFGVTLADGMPVAF